MGSVRKGFVAAGVLALLAGTALAQRPMFGGMQQGAGLVMNPGVQKELKLTEEQIGKAKDALGATQKEHADEMRKLFSPDVKTEERIEVQVKINEANYKALGDVLKADQVKRLREIDAQNSGVNVFFYPDVAKKMNYGKEQKEKLLAIVEDLNKETRDLFPGFQKDPEGTMKKMTALRKDATEKAEKTLSADQKKAWKELTGEKFEVKFERRPPER